MRILVAHNSYQQPGGEDAVAKTEYAMLKENGEEVSFYERSNLELEKFSRLKTFFYLWSAHWPKNAYREFRALLKKFRPQVAHFHNIYFMLSPAVYYACKDEKVAVVQSLHNFRLLCSNALFFRQGKVCEDCLTKKSLWYGVYHGCYKDSRLISALVVKMLEKHHNRRTWLNKVDAFITASEFTRQKYIQAGFPAERIKVKPNFLSPDPGLQRNEKGYALFVGRLSREKGVETLIKAWGSVNIPLKIVGDGDLRHLKEMLAPQSPVEFLGYVTPEVYDRHMREASVIVIPSECYENFPRIVAEAYAYGLPVVASRLGSLRELVIEGETGAMFEAGNARDLASQIKRLFSQEGLLKRMGQAARREYETKFTAQQNYAILKDIYQGAIAQAKG